MHNFIIYNLHIVCSRCQVKSPFTIYLPPFTLFYLQVTSILDELKKFIPIKLPFKNYKRICINERSSGKDYLEGAIYSENSLNEEVNAVTTLFFFLISVIFNYMYFIILNKYKLNTSKMLSN